MKLSNFSYILSLSILLFSCNKQEGLGGTSIIKGKLIGQNHSSAKAEVTEIIFTNGSSVEHGDYWLLNTPNTNNYFYIWYNNPSWVTNGDPSLVGRTGIKVTFNYSDSNIEIAKNTKDAILNITNQFEIEVLNDILVITNIVKGDTPDATDVSSPFDFNTQSQGQNSLLSDSEPLVDEKVYIAYGNNSTYNDDVSSGSDGSFTFSNLTKGNYKLYYPNKDTLTGKTNLIEIDAQISKNKSGVDLGELKVVY